jgi:hypothetical protein
VLGQQQSFLTADPTASAGDDRNPSLEQHSILVLSLRRNTGVGPVCKIRGGRQTIHDRVNWAIASHATIRVAAGRVQDEGTMSALVLLGILVLAVLWVVSAYNALVALRNRAARDPSHRLESRRCLESAARTADREEYAASPPGRGMET